MGSDDFGASYIHFPIYYTCGCGYKRGHGLLPGTSRAAESVGPGPGGTAAPPVPPLPGGVYEKENNIKIVEVVYTKNRHCITREDQKHEVFLVSCNPAKD